MAAPKDVTMKDLSGQWALNTKLSDPLEPMNTLLGVSWLIRTALSWATVKLVIRHYTAPPGSTDPESASGSNPGQSTSSSTAVEHIDIHQTMSGVPASKEHRILNWTARKSSNAVFGEVEGKSRRISKQELIGESLTSGDESLKKWISEGWSSDKSDAGNPSSAEDAGYVQSYVRSLEEARGRYQIEQIWGIGIVNGERRHVRRIRAWTEDDRGSVKSETRAMLVYDWLGREGEEKNPWDETV